MKRVLCFAAAMLFVAAFVGCSSSTNIDTGSNTGNDVRNTPSTVAQTSAPKQETVGTRKNPAKLNETVRVELDSILNKGIAEVSLIEVIRGDEAAKMVEDANMFNEPAPEGKEYILAKFHITFVQDKSGNDEPLSVNYLDFCYASSTFSLNDDISLVVVNDKLDLKLYEGASGEGYVLLIADKDDAGYAVFNDNIWFALS